MSTTRAHRDRAAARAVHVLDALGADDEAVGREVGALDALHQRLEQLLARRVGVLERPLGALGDLAQVVRRDVGGHADRDAGRAVDQQVRDARRQDRRLLRAAVVVGREVDGLLVDVAHHLHRDRRELALGVPHRGRAVVARRAEVALARDHRRAHDPRLRQAHEGVVDRGVAVRVVLTHDVTDDAAALVEAAVGAVAAVVHRVEHAAVHRLEAVAHVGQRTRDDDAHGVVDVRALHLVLQLDGSMRSAAIGVSVTGVSFVRVSRGRWLPGASTTEWSRGQMSRKRTSLALRWMNERRCSTSSPMRIVKISSATAASSRVT